MSAGMICSHLVNLSTLFGAVLSWGIMWPLISKQKGTWYPANVPETSMPSPFGYKSFMCVALIMGDGLYHFIKLAGITAKSLHKQSSHTHVKRATTQDAVTVDDMQRNEIFIREYIPNWLADTGYALLSIIAIIVISKMFRQVKWYYVVVAYVLAPVLGFSNAYGTGLADMNMSYNYGKIALFTFAAWGGKDDGVIAGLVGCAIVKQLVQVSADLMHDYKTGHLTLTSPRSMFVGQAIGTAMGCIIGPSTFLLFYKAFDIGNPEGYWRAPYALIYRNMAILGVEGFSALPKRCLELSAACFAFSVLINLIRDFSPQKYRKYIPLPMAMAVPFLVGANFTIDMCVGSLVVFA